LQEKVLKAKEELAGLEFGFLVKAKQKIATLIDDLHVFAEYIAWLDVFSAHAILAKEKLYIKPELSSSQTLDLVGARHPVIEEFLPADQQFIANDLEMGNKSSPDCTKGPSRTSFAMTGETELSN